MKLSVKQEYKAVMHAYPRGTRFLRFLLYVYFPYFIALQIGLDLFHYGRFISLGISFFSLEWLARFLAGSILRWGIPAGACLAGRRLRPGAWWWLQFGLLYFFLSSGFEFMMELLAQAAPTTLQDYTILLLHILPMLLILLYFYKRKDLFRVYTAEELQSPEKIPFTRVPGFAARRKK